MGNCQCVAEVDHFDVANGRDECAIGYPFLTIMDAINAQMATWQGVIGVQDGVTVCCRARWVKEASKYVTLATPSWFGAFEDCELTSLA